MKRFTCVSNMNASAMKSLSRNIGHICHHFMQWNSNNFKQKNMWHGSVSSLDWHYVVSFVIRYLQPTQIHFKLKLSYIVEKCSHFVHLHQDNDWQHELTWQTSDWLDPAFPDSRDSNGHTMHCIGLVPWKQSWDQMKQWTRLISLLYVTFEKPVWHLQKIISNMTGLFLWNTCIFLFILSRKCTPNHCKKNV